jgi:ASC-1-like (ASCH) protein
VQRDLAVVILKIIFCACSNLSTLFASHCYEFVVRPLLFSALNTNKVSYFSTKIVCSEADKKLFVGNIDLQKRLRGEFIEDICFRSKIYEGRLATSSFEQFQPGKIVMWQSTENLKFIVITKIIGREHYKNFEEMLEKISYKSFLPRASSLEEAKNIYNSFPGYLEDVKKYGALALKIEVVWHNMQKKLDYQYTKQMM